MLWTERYHPETLRDIVGQNPVIRHLSSFAASGTVPHLMLTGPHGTGKSVAIECFAKALYRENWELNTSVFSTADLFLQGKNYLMQDERYAYLYRRDQSLISNIKHIIKWHASMRPLDAPFKLMVFEDAHALTREAQQALRRIMERSSGTCRFIFSTINQSALIPAITSRCLPLFFVPIEPSVMLRHLNAIADKEQSGKHLCSDDDLELIVQASQGDMRRAILLLQAALESGRCGDLFTIAQSETSTIAASALTAIKEGDIRGAIRRLESMIIDYGLSGSEVFTELRTLTRREYNHPAIAIALADADYRIGHCNNEFVQIGAFATEIREVFI